MLKLTPLLLLSLFFASCYNDKGDQLYPTPTCDTSNVTYSGTISGILATNCALSGCHDGSTASKGIVLDYYNGVKSAVNGGRVIGAISHSGGYIAMPQGRPKLDDCTIAKISTWIANGAPNN